MFHGVLGALLTCTSLALPAGTASAEAAAVPVCGTSGAPSVVALADPSFYIDSSAGLFATYAGYTVRAGSQAETSLWLSVGNFTGGVVSRAPGQPADVALPNIAAAGTATSYLLLQAGAATATPQTHTVTLYRGHPVAGDAVCSRSYSYRGVYETIKALANKVDSVTTSVPSGEARIGDAVAVNVAGRTGTLGAGPAADPGVLSYAPNALASFPAGAWRLEKTTLTISPDGVNPPVTYTNRLYLPAASGPNREYTAEYIFRAVGPAAAPAAVQPVQYIASGTQVKHTDIGGGVIGALPTVSKDANLILTKTADTDVVSPGGGPITYTVIATNVGGSAGTIDRIVDTLPPGAAFQAGSARLGGRSVGNPHGNDRHLTWSGPITVPGGGTTALTYTVDLDGTAGIRTNAAVAYYGNAEIDSSRDVTVSDPAVATVNVLDGAGSARAEDDSITTAAGQAVAADVLANDSSTAGFAVHVQTVGSPGHGSASIRSDGAIVYTPAAGFAGVDTFSYILSDGYDTATATVTVTVTPIARTDVYVTAKSTTLSGTTVLANDDCPGCTVSLESGVATGTLTLAPNGTFTYVAPNQHAVATFGYRASAPGGTSATATATIHVNAAGPDYATTASATAVTIPVTANDTCPGGGNCSVSADTAPAHGTATYTAGSTNIVYRPASGFWGLDSFTYKLNGGAGATVKVLVAPPATAVGTTYGQPIAANLAAPAFSGSTTVGCAGCLYGVAANPTGGHLTVSGPGAASYTPNSGFAGTDSFGYTVTDPASGLTVTGTVTVTVGPNADDDTTSTTVTADVVVPVLGNDSCPGTCTVTIDGGPVTGTATVNGDRTITFSPAPGRDIGAVTFTYRVVSSLAPALSDTATVTVAVEGAADDAAITNSGQALAIPVTENDPCQDCTVTAVTTPNAGLATIQAGGTVGYQPRSGFSGTDTFTYQVTKNGRSSTATVTVTVLSQAIDDHIAVAAGTTSDFDPRSNDLCTGCVIDGVSVPSGGGTATVVDGQALRYTPGVGGGASEHFTYELTDTSGHTTTATVTVTVNAPPSAVDDETETEGAAAVVIDVLANDACAGCTVDVSADATWGTVVFRADGRAQYQPAPGFTGTDTFRYLATDPATGLSAEANVTVTVVPVALDDRASTARGIAAVVAVLENDVCAGCTVTLIQPAPGHGTAILTGDGTVTYTPGGGFEGTDQFGYRITDPATHRSADAAVALVVSNVTDDAATTPAGTAVHIDVLDNDTACGGCTIATAGPPSHGTASLSGDGIRYEPAAGFFGLDQFTYQAGSGDSLSTATVRILVAPPDRVVITDVNEPAEGNFDAEGHCPGCRFSVLDGPAWGDLALTPDGRWTYIPLPDTIVDDVVTYQIHDPVTGETTSARLTVSARSPEAPVATPDLALARTLSAPADTNGSGRIDAGDRLTSAYSVSNTGDVTVTAVTVGDNRADAGTIVCPTSNSATIASLASAAGETCTGIHTLTQADVDAGTFSTTATAAGTAGGSPISDSDNDEAAVPRFLSITVTLTLTGRDDRDGSGDDSPGDELHYAVTATNTGTTTLAAATVTEARGGGQQLCATLTPGASCAAGTTYRLTAADIGVRAVTNSATATATGPGGTPVQSSAAVQTALITLPPVGYTVSGVIWFDVDHDGRRSPGEPVIPGATVILEAGRNGAGSAGSAPRTGAAAPTTGTGADGRYRFESVPPGTYTVRAVTGTAVLPTSWDSDGQHDWHVTVTVTVTDVTANFASQPAGSLVGRVTERAGGRPIAGAALACTWPGIDGLPGTDDDVVFSGTADADGGYTISGVPAGRLTCTATDPASGRSVRFDTELLGAGETRRDVLLDPSVSGGGSAAPPDLAPTIPPAAPPATLPVTGADTRRHLVAALGLIAIGSVLTGATRRRSKDASAGSA